MTFSSDDEQWREYHVSPRYLAGSTFTGDPALRPLLDSGWLLNGDDVGNVYVNTPDQRVRLAYLPEGDDDALWKITAYSSDYATPRWLVTFQSGTPTEIVAGFTTALAAAYAEGPDSYLHHGNSALTALDAGTPLAAAGWSHSYSPENVFFQSPDRLAEVYLRHNHRDHSAEMRGHQERWLTLAGPPGNQWYATASSFTPQTLVTAMNTALTDPSPVIRYGYDLQRLPPQATATPVKPRMPTPLDIRRIQAANSRSTVPPTTTAARPVTPSPRSPPAPQAPRSGYAR
ncbi:DUF317 domain-containing protein [Streptomyces atroolivaceus]|uniref:DUF317 domain-containing protein n=1 Tax=Streptomyces atroolivaceus TaxID=66869 RepID=UPI002023F32E|nr:DUF317 domain-containing protein [Streptomyces atroolivaceus]